MIPKKSPIGSETKHFRDLGEQLGEGGFAKVYKAKCLQPGYQGQIVAIKKISKEKVLKKKLTHRITQEVAIHSQLQHPSIVKLFTAFEDDKSYYLVLEYCEKGTLSEYLKLNGRLQEEVAHDIVKQVLKGLLYLHSQNVIHRDLSLRNILLTEDMKVKIADFGLSTELSSPDEKKFTMLGTAHFMSPELMHKGNGHGMEVDIWALGCVLYALLVGKPPFDGGTVREIFKKATMCDVEIPPHVSKEAKDLIYALMQKEPEHRIDLEDVLTSPFYTKYSTNPPSHQKFDSGVGRMSSSTTRSVRSSGSSRSTGSSDSGVSIPRNRDYRSPSTFKDIVPMTAIHSMSGSHHSYGQLPNCYNCNNSREQTPSCPRSPPSKLKNSQRQMGSTQQLKNKLQMLPSRNEFHNPPTLEISSRERGRERSASEEVRKQERQKIRNDSTEYFRTQSKEHMDENALPYYRHQDNQIRSRPQSPMPYPIKRLENIIDENLQKSFSSSESRSKSNIFRENVDTCRKKQHLVREPDNRSHQSWEHQSATHAKSNKKKSLICEKPPPFNTVRLKPERSVYEEVVIMSLLSDGQVCLELLKRKKFVSSVCFISRDGMEIFLYKSKVKFPAGDGLPPPDNLRYLKSYRYEALPEEHWLKYNWASCFVKTVKAATPKINVYSDQGRFMMMENVPPNFRMIFLNGGKITEVSGKVHIFNKDGTHIRSSDANYPIMREEFNILKSRCEELAKALEPVQANNPEDSIFPCSFRINPSSPNQVKGKENINPSSIRSPSLSKAFANMPSYPHSSYSPLGNSCNTMSSPSENSNKYIKNQCGGEENGSKRQYSFKNRSMDDIRINLKGLPWVEGDKVVAEYKDGLEMWSTRTGDEVYFYHRQSGKSFTDLKPGSDLSDRICRDLKGILLYIEQKRNKR